MTPGLEIRTEWIGSDADPCAARLAILVDGLNAFRAENRWSRSIDEAPPLSALPLARWLATHWWRLRWEPAPANRDGSVGWRMAHEVAAGGGGFLWPRLTFTADGEGIEACVQPTPAGSSEMLRYLADFTRMIPAADFEQAVDRFLALVIERLAVHGVEPGLAELWTEVRRERTDPELARHRRLEALLGLDAGEASDEVAARFGDIRRLVGEQTTDELASACAGPRPTQQLAALRAHAEASQLCGTPAGLPRLDASATPRQAPPHERGRRLAHALRMAIPLGPQAPVKDSLLGELLGLTEQQLTTGDQSNARLPAGVAMSQAGRTALRYTFRQQRRPTSRRFEGARFLGDLLAHPHEPWHPASEAWTARQKEQRAFAAEFLAPIAAIKDYLSGDYSRDAIEGAAEYFDVSAYAIGGQLSNNRVIARDHPAAPP